MSGNVLFMSNVSNCSEIVLEAQRACRQFRKTRISSCLCLFFFKVYLVCILSNPTKLCRVTAFACLKRFSSAGVEMLTAAGTYCSHFPVIILMNILSQRPIRSASVPSCFHGCVLSSCFIQLPRFNLVSASETE